MYIENYFHHLRFGEQELVAYLLYQERQKQMVVIAELKGKVDDTATYL
jgi:hypothetical protein